MARRSIDDTDADRQVAAALRARGGSATLADIVVATALPEKTAERSLSRLLEDYDSSVSVAKGGALIYEFTVGPLGMRRRRERRALLRALVTTVATTITALVATVRFLFRAVLAIQLLVYLVILLAPVSAVIGAVVGVVILVVGIVGAITEGGDIGGLLELLVNPWALAIIYLGCAIYGCYLVFKKKITLIMALVGKDDQGRTGLVGFIEQVNDFALGPEKPPSRADRIDRAWAVSQPDERVVLARVRKQGGRLRAGHLVAWLGLDLDQAERQATRIAVEYGGEPTATDVDVVEFEMASLMTTTGEQDDAPDKTAHERGRPKPRLTGNRFGEDLVIVLFAAFTGGAGAWIATWMGGNAMDGVAYAGWWQLGAWIGWGALGFSILLFGLFVVRVPWFFLMSWVHTRRTRRWRIHDAIVRHATERGREALDLDALARRQASTGGEVRMIALGLEGAFDLDAKDDPQRTEWRFARLARELAEPKEPRRQLKRAEALTSDR